MLLATDGVVVTSADVSDFVCRLRLIPRKICYVKCLVEEVQCSKLFQDFTRGICYIRPGWNAAACRDVRQDVPG